MDEDYKAGGRVEETVEGRERVEERVWGREMAVKRAGGREMAERKEEANLVGDFHILQAVVDDIAEPVPGSCTVFVVSSSVR